jgi:hypothetical protein
MTIRRATAVLTTCILPGAILSVLAACGADLTMPPAEPDSLLVADIGVTGRVAIGEGGLIVESVLHNRGAQEQVVALRGGACELLVRVYERTGTIPILDEAQPTAICEDIGGEVSLAPGATYTLRASRSIDYLRAAGIDSGIYRVAVVIPEFLDRANAAVSAGTVTIP